MPVRRGEIGLFVADIARSVGFYMATLGFQRVPDPAWGESDGTWEKIQSGDLVLTIFKGKSPAPSPAPGSQSGMCADMLTDDLDGTVKRLKAAGAKVGPIRDWPGGRVAEFTDLDGIAWSLISEEK